MRRTRPETSDRDAGAPGIHSLSAGDPEAPPGGGEANGAGYLEIALRAICVADWRRPQAAKAAVLRAVGAFPPSRRLHSLLELDLDQAPDTREPR